MGEEFRVRRGLNKINEQFNSSAGAVDPDWKSSSSPRQFVYFPSFKSICHCRKHSGAAVSAAASCGKNPIQGLFCVAGDWFRLRPLLMEHEEVPPLIPNSSSSSKMLSWVAPTCPTPHNVRALKSCDEASQRSITGPTFLLLKQSQYLLWLKVTITFAVD